MKKLEKNKKTASKEDNKSSKIFSELLRMLVMMLDQKGYYIRGHADRVAGNCVQFSKNLGLSKKEIDRIHIAALLHDIGMIYIPHEILKKPDKLTEAEMDIVRHHPVIAETILSPLSIFKEVIPIIRHHHELFDGSGYPDGLKGAEIPIESRILCLIDSYEAMIGPRMHQSALTVPEALQIVRDGARKRFDWLLADQFIAFIKSTPKISKAIKIEKKEMDMRGAVDDIVRKVKNDEIVMPVLPKVIYEIQNVIKKKNITIEDLARIIEGDAVISVKMLSIANSPLYRGAEPFTTVRQAITRLGFEQTNSIITMLASRDLYHTQNRAYKELMERLWLHSLACAFAARTLAFKLRFEYPEKMFLLGLLHDIGMPLLIKAVDDNLFRDKTVDRQGVIKAIKEFHSSVGGALLQRWDFPRDFSRAAEQHEGPHFFETTPKHILVVNLADRLAAKIGYGIFDDDDGVELWELESAKLLQLNKDLLFSLTENIGQVMQKTTGTYINSPGPLS
jgi:HD-GYP domain-containing protein (c-di-GMP phosphodiesterase class II)